ncbi:MAG: hypothetical protein AAFX03_12235 [Pseudomonadota bacterium]
MTRKSWMIAAGIALGGFSTSGCVIAAVAAGGYVAVDEATENDGEFDPFEDVIEDITDTEDGEDG